MIKKNITEKELHNRIMSLLNANLDTIDPDIVMFIKQNWREQDKVDVLYELYDEVAALDERTNIYDGFFNLLKKKFDINQDIIEIGGGIFPNLSRRIAKEQKFGNVTVYDPKLILRKYSPENLALKKEMFEKDTPIGNAKLLVGMSPCHSIDLILERASTEDLDFMVKVCQCEIKDSLPFYSDHIIKATFDYYLKRKNNEFQANGGPGFNVAYLEEEYDDPTPIIYTKKRPM